VCAGDPTGAIEDFEAFGRGIEPFIAEQPPILQAELRLAWGNARSNAGLAYLAVGSEEQALDLWSQSAEEGHLEALAYPAVLAWHAGQHSQACELLAARLTQARTHEFTDVMIGVLKMGQGWAQAWARDALDLVLACDHVDGVLKVRAVNARWPGTDHRAQRLSILRECSRSGVPTAIREMLQDARDSDGVTAARDVFESYRPCMDAFLAQLPFSKARNEEPSNVPFDQGSFWDDVSWILVEAGDIYAQLDQPDQALTCYLHPRVRRDSRSIVGRALLAQRQGDEKAVVEELSRLIPPRARAFAADLDARLQEETLHESSREWLLGCMDLLTRAMTNADTA